MIIIETSSAGEHIINKSDLYILRDLETNTVSKVLGDTLIKQLTSDKNSNRPYRYANVKSPYIFVKHKDVSLAHAIVSLRGNHSCYPVNSSSIKFIDLNESYKIYLIKLLNLRYITISVKRPELYDRDLGVLYLRIGTHRETFSMNLNSDFMFRFSDLSQKNGVVSSELFIDFTSSGGRPTSTSLGFIKLYKDSIKYKDEVMPYISEETLSSYISSGEVKNLLP